MQAGDPIDDIIRCDHKVRESLGLSSSRTYVSVQAIAGVVAASANAAGVFLRKSLRSAERIATRCRLPAIVSGLARRRWGSWRGAAPP